LNPQLEDLVKQASYAIAFTGAGVSTLSGLPAFRGPKGLYNDPDYARMFDIDLFLTDPSFYYTKGKNLLYGDLDPSASLVHQNLALWEKQGWLKAVITQNIDLLHQKAGSRRVIEIHGTPDPHQCLGCGKTESYESIRRRVQNGEIPPRCACGGVFKPLITFFGEALPQNAWDEAIEEVGRCDLILVLGTSLTVYPAASLPQHAARRGASLVIVNDQPTPLDHLANLRFWDLEKAFSP